MKKTKKPKRPKQRRALNKKPAFLAAFKVCASLTEAAAAIGIDRGEHYDWLRKDAKYAAAFDAAKAEAAQSLEDEAVTRARKGVYEPLVYQGNFTWEYEQYEITPAVPARDWKDPAGAADEIAAQIGHRIKPGSLPLGVWKKSDGLMMFLLRGFMPQKYRHGVEVTGANGGAIVVSLAEVLRERKAKREAAEPA